MKSTEKIAIGILLGTIAGAALGMLFAPKKNQKPGRCWQAKPVKWSCCKEQLQ